MGEDPSVFQYYKDFEIMFFFNILIRNVCTINYPSASCVGSRKSCLTQKAEMAQLGLGTKHELDVILHPSKHRDR